MIGKEIKSRRSVPLYEVKEIMKTRSEQSELGYEQSAAFEYAKKHAKISRAKGEKLLKELERFEELDENMRITIVDLLPNNMERLRLLIPKTVKIDEEKLKEIMGVVENYLP